MLKKINIYLVFSLLLLIVLCCTSTSSNQGSIADISEDSSLSSFIIGKWISIEAYDNNGLIIGDYIYEIDFVDSNTVKLLTAKNDGQFLDGITYSYKFDTQNTIFVERTPNGVRETWELQRVGQKLIVMLQVGNSIYKYIMTRIIN